jgi:tRNA(Arg) A34 adenosine deaminase TadA
VGPGAFRAAIFRETNKLLAPGANLVLSSGYSFAHAEMVAIVVAQQIAGNLDLDEEGSPLTSWSPAPSLASCASVRFPGPV